MKINPKDILYPTCLLLIVCLVTSAAVVGTNALTEKRISELAAQEIEEAKQEVLPEAESFEEVEVTQEMLDAAGVAEDLSLVSAFKATNDAGYVISTSNKGYGGQVSVMTGITADGQIAAVKVVSADDETAGLGQKALDPSFTDQYQMTIPEEKLTVTKMGKSADHEIEAIAGATITSNSVTTSVNDAIAVYRQITGGGN